MNDQQPNPETMNNDTHPELCNHCKPLVESSKLEWIKLGGQSVSIPKKPLHWVLRDKYSDDVINANANYSQQLAAKSRELATVTEQRDRLAVALERLEKTAGGRTWWDDPARVQARQALQSLTPKQL